MLGRLLEFRVGHPMTSTGEPATTEHLRRYPLAAAALGLAVWIAANWLSLISGDPRSPGGPATLVFQGESRSIPP